MNAPEAKQYDFEYTQALYQLLGVPADQRNEQWQKAFFQVVADAPLALAKEQVLRGPDGFLYFVLVIPEDNKEFQPVSIRDVLEHVTQSGYGCAILPREDATDRPLYVFTYGDMFSLRHHGNLIGDPQDQKELLASGKDASQPAQGGEALLGAPSFEYLPQYVRNVMGSYLKQVHGIDSPSVALVVHVASAPTRNLVFNFAPQNFASEEEYVGAVRRMRWFMPRVMGLMDNLAIGESLKGKYAPLLQQQ